MSVWNVIGLAGGLALFIFGMNLMSDGLKLVAGSYLKKILEKLTKNRILAMLVGAGLTALIQKLQCHVCHGSWICKCRYDAAGEVRRDSDGCQDRNDDHRTADCF